MASNNGLNMGRRNIGALVDNSPKNKDDMEFAKIVNTINLKLWDLSLNGKPKSVEELQDRIKAFFDIYATYGINPTVEGLAIALDYDRKSLFDIAERERFKPEFADIIKKTKNMIANYDATLAQNGRQNSAVYIFRSKNFYGMKDVQQVEVAPTSESDKPNDSNDLLNTLPEAPDKGTVNVDSKETASSEEE